VSTRSRKTAVAPIFPRWASRVMQGQGVETLHREVTAGIFVGGAYHLPPLGWFPQGLVVVDLRRENEPPPPHVGAAPSGRPPSFTDLRAHLAPWTAVRVPLERLRTDQCPDGAAWRRAVEAVLGLWGAQDVLILSRSGLLRAPLVAYAVLRRRGFGPEDALRRTGLMVGDRAQQAPTHEALAWAEADFVDALSPDPPLLH
jgi:hypothetical protein